MSSRSNRITKTLVTLAVTGCSSIPAPPRSSNIRVTRYPLKNPPAISDTLKLGGFSGLHFLGKDASSLRFLTHTDRGPNLDESFDARGRQLRPFALPEFQPQLVELRVDLKTGTTEVVRTLKLKNAQGKPMSGLPVTSVSTAITKNEVPVDLNGHELKTSPDGIDPESLVVRDDGYWLGEEYLPSILHFSKDATLLARYSPGHGLPKVYAHRQVNRGFEAMAESQGKLYAFLQSPLNDCVNRYIRVLEFDPAQKTATAQYLFALDNPKADKIGDAMSTAVAGVFWIIEQDSKTGPTSNHRIVEIDLNHATRLPPEADGETVLECTPPGQKLQLAAKRVLFDLVGLGLHEFDKLEGLAQIDGHRFAVVNDNDFNAPKGATQSSTLTVFEELR